MLNTVQNVSELFSNILLLYMENPVYKSQTFKYIQCKHTNSRSWRTPLLIRGSWRQVKMEYIMCGVFVCVHY